MKKFTTHTIFFAIILALFTTEILRASNAFIPPLIGFLINNGAKVTNNRNIEVRIKPMKSEASLIEQMKVGLTPDLSDVAWKPYSEQPQKLYLKGEDGEKMIYAQLKDKAGNFSPIESTSIILDTQPPQSADILINKGVKYTNDNLGRVYLQFNVKDAAEMQVSNKDQFTNQGWEPFAPAKNWNIEVGSGDGEKVVYARFRDAAGNISGVFSQSIILDTKPPQDGKLIIEQGEKYLKKTKVNVKVGVDDAYLVRLVDRQGGENYEYKPGADGMMEVTWTFDTLQGEKVLRAYFMDEAKNKTSAAVEARYIYDTKPPAPPKVIVDNNHKYVSDKEGNVNLNIVVKQQEPELKVMISNSPSYENVEKRGYDPLVRNWKIDMAEDGLKNIYVWLIDEAGNVSDPGIGKILLDRTPPEVVSFGINDGTEWTIRNKVNLSLQAKDAEMMQISNNPNFTSASRWEKYNEKKFDWALIPGDGTKQVFVRFKDEAGNVSETVDAEIKLDSQPPRGKLIVNNGEKFTNDPQGLTDLKILYDGDDVAGMQISNKPNFDDVQLIPVKSELSDWQLSEGDGVKTIFLRLKDKAGNYSDIITDNVKLDRAPPQNCEITINNGKEWLFNENKKVALSLLATDVEMMMISNDEAFSNASWQPFKTAISWTLEGPEGKHQVFAKYKDAAGNVSEVVSASIKSDFHPPKVNLFAINGDEKYTNNAQKQVILKADVEEAVSMAIANEPITPESAWEPFQSEKEWILSNEDGPKTVYARFKDEAGNVTEEFYDKIILDRMPPTECGININQGAEWMTNPDGEIVVHLKANGASEVILSSDESFKNAEWVKAQSEIKRKIDVSKKELTLYARFRDNAGNVSDVVSHSIKIDVEPPKNAQIIINDGEKYLIGEEKKMKVGISVEGAKEMQLSMDKNFRDTQWEPLGGIKEIVLLEGDGVKTVYARFKDQAGNMSEIVSDDILVDTTPPTIIDFKIDDGAEWTNDKEKKVDLYIEAEQAKQMRIDHDPAFSNSKWQPFSSTIEDYQLPGDDGLKTIFVRLKDEAGNVSQPVSAKIKLKRSF